MMKKFAYSLMVAGLVLSAGASEAEWGTDLASAQKAAKEGDKKDKKRSKIDARASEVMDEVLGERASSAGAVNTVVFRDDVVGSLLKAWIFGALVGLIATYRGFTCAPNAAGVSRATPSTVVTGSVCILLFDYVITALWGV